MRSVPIFLMLSALCTSGCEGLRAEGDRKQGDFELLSVHLAGENEFPQPPEGHGRVTFFRKHGPDDLVVFLKTPADPHYRRIPSPAGRGSIRAYLRTAGTRERPIALERLADQPRTAFVSIPAHAPAEVDELTLILRSDSGAEASWKIKTIPHGKQLLRSSEKVQAKRGFPDATVAGRAFRLPRNSSEALPMVCVEVQATEPSPEPDKLLSFATFGMESPVVSQGYPGKFRVQAHDFIATDPAGFAQTFLFADEYKRIAVAGTMVRWKVEEQSLRLERLSKGKYRATTKEGHELLFEVKEGGVMVKLGTTLVKVASNIDLDGQAFEPYLIRLRSESANHLRKVQLTPHGDFLPSLKLEGAAPELLLVERKPFVHGPFRLILDVGNPPKDAPSFRGEGFEHTMLYTPEQKLTVAGE